MKKIIFLVLIFPFLPSAQILPQFPSNQSPYEGGYGAYYTDFKDIIAQENLQPCTNKMEFYQFSVLINADASINFIKDQNQDYFAANKCASDLARSVAKHQTKWNPAVVDGEKTPALATFLIFPADYFQDKADYSPVITYPKYDYLETNHMEAFRKQLIANFNLKRFAWNDVFTVEAEFIISKEGKMKDIVLTKKTGLEEFDRMIYFAFKDMRKKWKPATINGNPVDYRYKYHLSALPDPE